MSYLGQNIIAGPYEVNGVKEVFLNKEGRIFHRRGPYEVRTIPSQAKPGIAGFKIGVANLSLFKLYRDPGAGRCHS